MLRHLSLIPIVLLLGTAMSCSKLDKNANCLNEKSACFKEDKTAPQLAAGGALSPTQGAIVSVLSTVDLQFSEELNNPQPSDFVFSGAANMTVNAVQQIDRYTYRLVLTQNSLTSGTIYLDFPNLRDYNGNKITGSTTVTYIGNVDIPVTLNSVSHYGVSNSGGYSSIDVSWQYAYIPPAASSTIYTVKLTTGSTDCNGASPVSVDVPSITVGSAVTSSTAYTFSLTYTNISGLPGALGADGAKVLLICIDNATYNKHGTAVINLVKDNSAPSSSLTPLAPVASATSTPPPPTAASAVPKVLTFNCSDNADRILYHPVTTVGTGVVPLLGDVTDPAFVPGTGAVSFGTLYNSSSKPVTPYGGSVSDNPTITTYKYVCIDKAGNIESGVKSAVFEIDSSLPAVTLTNVYKTGTTVSIWGISTGGYTSADFIWNSNQVNKYWEIRAGGTSCGSGGLVVASSVTTGQTTPSPANTPVTTAITPSSPGLVVGNNALLLCVGNNAALVSVTKWGQESFNLLLDNTAPAAPTVNIAAGNFGAVQNLVFSCSATDDNEDKVAYSVSTLAGATAPAAPTAPDFDANGVVSSGTLQTTPLATPNQSTSVYRAVCIDRAGNKSPALTTAAYRVDSILPTITIVSNTHDALSSVAGYTSTTLSWRSSRGGLPFEIRKNSTNCTDGTVLNSPASVSGTTPVDTNQIITSTFDNVNFGTEGSYTLLVCVQNYINQWGYTQKVVVRDNTPPSFGGLTSITNAGSGNFTLGWAAATDSGSGVASYNLYQSTTSGTYSTTPSYAANSPSLNYLVTGLNPATTYFFIAGVVDNAGNETKVSLAELATRLNLTVSVSGYTASPGSFIVQQGGDTLAFNAAPGGTQTFATGFTPGASYSVSINAQPGRQNCAFVSDQYGTINSNLTLQVNCVAGYLNSGAMTLNKPIALGYHLYRGNATILAGGGSGTICPGSNATNCYDGVGNAARFFNPHGITIVNGVIYIADRENNRIRKYDIATNTTTTFAGEGSAASTDGTGTSARINKPQAITSDGVNLYVAESPTSPAVAYLRRIHIATQQVTTIAGGASVAGGTSCPGAVQSSCRDGSAFQALFGLPNDIDYHNGILYISEYGNNRIRKMSLATGQVTTMAGDGNATSVDSSTGTSASFNGAAGQTVLGNNLYVVDFNGHRIRSVSLTAPYAVTTLAGTGTAGHADGPTATAQFNNADHIFADGRDLYITEYGGNKVRRVNLAKNIVSTLAGSGAATDAAGIGAQVAFAGSMGIVSDGSRFYVMTYNGGRLFRVSDAGLVGYWPIDPGVNPNDYSSDNTFSLNGSVVGGSLGTLTDRFGNVNGASLLGSGQQVTASAAGLPVGNAPRTMCAWVKPAAAPTATHLIATYGSTAVNQSFGIVSVYSGGVEYVGLSGYGADLFVPHTLPTTKWTHLCAWADGTTGRLYLNGKAVGSYTHAFATASAGMRIGAQLGDLQYFGGGITDVRIYSRALSEGEINELAQDAAQAEVGPTFSKGGTGLLAQYSFNYGTPATANLQPSGPLGGVLGNSASSPVGKDGDASGAAYFSGSANLPASATGLPAGNAPRTLCAYLAPRAYPAGTFAYAVAYGDVAPFSGFGIAIKDIGGGAYQIGNTFSSGSDNLINFKPPLNAWSHLCGTYDGSISRLYLNGVLMGSQTATLTTTLTSFTLGSWLDTTQILQGKLDDVRVYNNALSAEQIRELATQVREGLVLHLDTNGDFNDVSGFGNSVVTNPGSPVAGRRGVANTAYRFVAPQQAQIAHSPELMQQTDISWTFWMKSPDMSAINGQIFGKYVPTPNSGWVIKYDQSNFAHGWTVGTAGSGASSNSQPVPSNNVWNHYAFVRSGAGLIVYINGVSYSNVTSGNGSAIIPNTVNVNIGLNATGDASFQDLRIYNRALSIAEVQALSGYHAVQSVAGLSLHVQADTFSNLSDGAAITGSWINSVIQSTLGPNGSASGNPRFVSGTSSLLGGMPAVEFDGSVGKYFDFGFPTYNYSGLTVCAAATRKGNSYRGLIEKRGIVAASNSWAMLTDLPTSALKFEMDSTFSAEVVTPIADDTPAIYCVISGAGNLLSSYLNGQASASTSKAIISGANSDRLVVGSRFDLASSYYGQIGEVLVMTKDASAAERRIAECYLSAKYAIPLAGGANCP